MGFLKSLLWFAFSLGISVAFAGQGVRKQSLSSTGKGPLCKEICTAYMYRGANMKDSWFAARLHSSRSCMHTFRAAASAERVVASNFK